MLESLYQKETPAQVFPVNITKFLRTDFSYGAPMVAGSDSNLN